MTGRVKVVSLLLVAGLLACGGCAIKPDASGFAPVYPQPSFSGFPIKAERACVGAPGSTIDGLDWVPVDSLEPILRWAPFPGTHYSTTLPSKTVPFVDVDPARVSDVTYQVRIWQEQNDQLGELVFECDRVAGTSCKVEPPLRAKTHYYWSIRARFKLDGNERISEWTVSQQPCCHGFFCGRDSARAIGAVPALNAYRFVTP